MDMKDKQKGMTLIELVIGLGLMSMVLAVLYAIFFTGLKSFDRQMENANSQTTARQTLSYIGREIRRAEKKIEVDVDNKGLKVEYGGSEIKYEFNRLDNILYRVKNGTKNPMIEGIKDFNIEYSDDTYFYFLNITVISERHNNPITISTKIRKRE
jgi:prepilin-type N-terminal cleavage/methylation domain-containing protein